MRTKKIIGNKTHEYYYENGNLALEVIREGTEAKQYRYYQWEGTQVVGMILRAKDASGTWGEKVYHFWTNHRGDVLSIRDEAGNEVGSYTYDAYGNVLSETGEVAKENPIRYAGYYYDVETKHYYLQARYYNPENRNFLDLDPYPGDVDDPISQNGYTYADNNPVMMVDPDGHIAVFVGFGIQAAVHFVRHQVAKYFGKKLAKKAYKVLKPWLKKVKANPDNYKVKVTLYKSNDFKFQIAIFKKGKGAPLFRLEYHVKDGKQELHYHIGTKKYRRYVLWAKD